MDQSAASKTEPVFRKPSTGPDFEVQPVKHAKVIQVVHIQALKGSGTANSPIRLLDQYWSLEGYLLAETDQWEREKVAEESLVSE